MLPDSRQSRSEPPVAPQRAAAVGLVRTEGNVPFSDWLELSWFYPEGFRKERIIETERSWVVLGEQIVLTDTSRKTGASNETLTDAKRSIGIAASSIADTFRKNVAAGICRTDTKRQAAAGPATA